MKIIFDWDSNTVTLNEGNYYITFTHEQMEEVIEIMRGIKEEAD
jgi:hypothetical protein